MNNYVITIARTCGSGGSYVGEALEEKLEEEENTKIDCLIYLSDGFGGFPAEEPEYPVFFILPGSCNMLPKWVEPIYYKKIFEKK